MKDARFVLLLTGLILSGCGQPGPLYLPGDKPPIYVPPEAQPETKTEPKPAPTPQLPPHPDSNQPTKEQ